MMTRVDVRLSAIASVWRPRQRDGEGGKSLGMEAELLLSIIIFYRRL